MRDLLSDDTIGNEAALDSFFDPFDTADASEGLDDSDGLDALTYRVSFEDFELGELIDFNNKRLKKRFESDIDRLDFKEDEGDAQQPLAMQVDSPEEPWQPEHLYKLLRGPLDILYM